MANLNDDVWGDMLKGMKEDKEASGKQSKFWQPPSDKEGTFPIRILPPLKPLDETRFYFQHAVHWVDRVSYECLNQTLVDKNGREHVSEECPICQFVKRLYRTAERDSDEWKLAGELSAKPRYVYRIIVRGKEDETLPEFYETGKTIFDVLCHIILETDFGVIVDLKNGRDFNLVKKGVKRQARYDQSLPTSIQTPLFKEPERMKKALENAKSMRYNNLVEFVSYETLEKALRTYLGTGSSGQAQPSVSKTSGPAATATSYTQKSTTKEEAFRSADADDADIDDIVKEFGN